MIDDKNTTESINNTATDFAKNGFISQAQKQMKNCIRWNVFYNKVIKY